MGPSQNIFISMVILLIFSIVLFMRNRGIDIIIAAGLIPVILARSAEYNFLGGRSSETMAKYVLFSLWLVPSFVIVGIFLNMGNPSQRVLFSLPVIKTFLIIISVFTILSLSIALFWAKNNKDIYLDYGNGDHLRWIRNKTNSGRLLPFLGNSNALYSMIMVMLSISVLALNMDIRTLIIMFYIGVSWLYITLDNDHDSSCSIFFTFLSGAAFLSYILWIEK